jgi:hypothetical protein
MVAPKQSWLPPGTPLKYRISVFLVNFLQYHNRLDGLMSFVAIWWALWTLLLPDFWHDWPVTAELSRRTYGHPYLLSWILLASGSVGYMLRTILTIAAFCCWGVLTLVFLSVEPVFSPGVACYSAFAIAKLMAYVNHVTGIDRLPLERRSHARIH